MSSESSRRLLAGSWRHSSFALDLRETARVTCIDSPLCPGRFLKAISGTRLVTQDVSQTLGDSLRPPRCATTMRSKTAVERRFLITSGDMPAVNHDRFAHAQLLMTCNIPGYYAELGNARALLLMVRPFNSFTVVLSRPLPTFLFLKRALWLGCHICAHIWPALC